MRSGNSLISENTITATLFLTVLASLTLISIYRLTVPAETISSQEKRPLSSWPSVNADFKSVVAFPMGFQKYFNDRFAFRMNFIGAINFMKYEGFGVAAHRQLLAGKHGWLFFTDGGDEETMRHVPLLSDAELENWTKVLEARRAWLALHHIKYLVVVAPSKCTIYPEELPDAVTRLNPSSRFDQLLASLKGTTTVQVLDLRKPIKSAKAINPVYYRTDTHWNCFGAYIAYREIINHLQSRWFPQLKALDGSDVKFESHKFRDGDLSNMLALRDLLAENAIGSIMVRPPRQVMSKNPTPHSLNDEKLALEPYATEVADSTLPTAFCLRDSFMSMPHYFLSENFRRIVYYWRDDFPTELIEQEHPDVVIQEFVERKLARPVFSNPAEVDKCLSKEFIANKIQGLRLAGVRTTPAN